MTVGANYSKNETEFVVWAPHQTQLSLVLTENNQILKMDSDKNGYWRLEVEKLKPNTRYLFRLKDQSRPDPASNFQPEGVFGPSAVVNHSSFVWSDNNWHGVSPKDMILYELHIGTFSPEGNFEAAMKKAKELSETGINAVELMPVSQFSGDRNWGYDTVFPFAVQNSYGGPDELKKLVQEFHSKGISVFLDVVYNHLGPEGNFFNAFGPYFLFNRMTPWGASINFDGDLSSHVRKFFLDNTVHWFKNYHIDGLRLDAVFAIKDNSPKHFLEELSETVEKLSKAASRKLLLIAENNHVEPKIVQSRKMGGFGLDAVWHDNLHHSLHAILTGERNWYYSSFGSLEKIVQALKENCIENSLVTQDSSGKCTSKRLPSNKLVVFTQNHDQIGNRPQGKRLITLAGREAAKLAAGLIILSPFTPLLFMGEEYGETSPFLFFTDYTDELLKKKVRNGRKKELKQNGWKNNPPDPQQLSTFLNSKINWQLRVDKKSRNILAYYQKLMSLRKDFFKSNFNEHRPTKFFLSKSKSLLVIQKSLSSTIVVTVANFSKVNQNYCFPCKGGDFIKLLDSADTVWAGTGSALPMNTKQGDAHIICPLSLAVYVMTKEKNYA